MKTLKLITIAFLPFLLFSCVGNKSLQTGRTLGHGKKELGGGVSSFEYQSNSNENGDTSPIPAMHISYKYGVSENVDLYASLGTYMSGLGIKYQILGDKNSKFAASLGMDLESGLLYRRINLPTHLSFHPSDKLGLYYSIQPSFYNNPVVFHDITYAAKSMGYVKGIELKLDKTKIYIEHSLTSFKKLSGFKINQWNFGLAIPL